MLVHVGPAPQEALAAAADFHARVVPDIDAALADAADLVIVFPPADHTHHGWRLAAIQALARAHAPVRVNALAGDDAAAIAAATAWLDDAPGVTGQVLRLDGHGAGGVLG